MQWYTENPLGKLYKDLRRGGCPYGLDHRVVCTVDIEPISGPQVDPPNPGTRRPFDHYDLQSRYQAISTCKKQKLFKATDIRNTITRDGEPATTYRTLKPDPSGKIKEPHDIETSTKLPCSDWAIRPVWFLSTYIRFLIISTMRTKKWCFIVLSPKFQHNPIVNQYTLVNFMSSHTGVTFLPKGPLFLLSLLSVFNHKFLSLSLSPLSFAPSLLSIPSTSLHISSECQLKMSGLLLALVLDQLTLV